MPELAHLVEGDGPPVVLSHPLGMDRRMWDAIAPALAAGHAVLRYDHRAHGASGVPPGPYAMDDLVEDAARLVRDWGRGPVAWIGLSMGGMVGQGLAARHPDLVSRLVIANSSAYYPAAAREAWAQRIATVERDGLAAIADTVMARYFSAAWRAANPSGEAEARRTLLASDPAGYVACCHAVAGVDWREALPRIRCPALVIAGALDQGAPVAMSEDIARAIPGARLAVIPEASHISAVEAPEAFLDLVHPFLAERLSD